MTWDPFHPTGSRPGAECPLERGLHSLQIMLDEETATLVNGEFFHQCRTDTHGHRADHLAASSLRIQNTTLLQRGSFANRRLWNTSY
jgi:hypothetical protein